MKRLIIVEGLPCSGKSTTARYIAEKLGYTFVDEGTGSHPADYEFHAYLTREDIAAFSSDEREQILASASKKSGGYIVPLGAFSGELFDKLLQYKVYDFLPWETERPVMLDKWREFVQNIGGESYVFNCVLLQNPMCETMMRFGFDEAASEAYIREIYGIIKPLAPFVVYLHNTEVYDSVKRASAERGDDWLNAVIDYHTAMVNTVNHKVSADLTATSPRSKRDSSESSQYSADWTSTALSLMTRRRTGSLHTQQ